MLNKIKNFMINAVVWTGALTVAFVILGGIYVNSTVLDWLMYLPDVLCIFIQFLMMMPIAYGVLRAASIITTKINIRRNRKYFTVAK